MDVSHTPIPNTDLDAIDNALPTNTKSNNSFLLLMGVVVVVMVMFAAVVMTTSTKNEQQHESGDDDDDGGVMMPMWANEMLFTPKQFNDNCVTCKNVDDVIAAVICWKQNKNKTKNEITIAMAAHVEKKTSYLALGISENGGMSGADIITYGDEIGLHDRFSTSFTRPLIDPVDKQDATLLTSGYQNGVMSFVFSRPIRVCKDHTGSDFDIEQKETFVIWAFGSVWRNEIQYHGVTDRGVVDINFFSDKKEKSLVSNLSELEPTTTTTSSSMSSSSSSTSSRRPSVSSITTTMPSSSTSSTTTTSSSSSSSKTTASTTITPTQPTQPTQPTHTDIRMHNGQGEKLNLETATNGTDTYICLSFPFTPLTQKHHIHQIDVLIENAAYVHHMFLYHCVDVGVGVGGLSPALCRMDECKAIVTGWGLGGERVQYFPYKTGFPLSETGAVEYFKLEIHYYAVTPPIGILDNSGFRIHYRLPQGPDAGMGFFGWRTNAAMTIPPGLPVGSPNSTFVGYLPHQCLPSNNSIFGDEGIHLFTGTIHMHQFGRKGIVRHFRGNVELAPLIQAGYYDFNYQRMTKVDRKLLRGDTLQLTCSYDTTSSSIPITGGEGSNNEMCLFFFHYYPRIKNLFDRNVATILNDGVTHKVVCSDRQKVILVPNNFTESVIEYVEPARDQCGV